jgi:acyl-CoA synthetase (AMP-forming)/AMP-acid ligase II
VAAGAPAKSIRSLLLEQVTRRPGATALLAPGRPGITYAGLLEQADATAGALRANGVQPGHRVAIVLPNGPEMASAFLGVAGAATGAPLNPAYRAQEFDFYLGDLDARAVVVQAGMDTPARDVARERGISVLELAPRPDGPAGAFTLAGGEVRGGARGEKAVGPEDVALVLHTSGTTSRPKMVPLTGSNLVASASHIRAALRLTPEDRCLNVMSLFHIHGLMAALLASLAAGGSVVCTPGFYAPQFFGWMGEFRPTWYTAVPTMHQGVLSRAAANASVIERSPLRLVRSSSSSLAPSLMAELEETFAAPVIEAYGMTEASHQIASNPLPPGDRRPGSVGVAAGPEATIMDEEGSDLLAPGAVGEIVIRGPNVTCGYADNPAANALAFSDGWFRTGDQGRLDGEGYLYITGRFKEIINRGGETIAPREIDEALLEHAAVAQAVAFAAPHQMLGEDVAAAVVLNRAGPDEQALRLFAAQRLAPSKVPSRIVIVDEIPKGPTGKLQRIGLAERLGLGEGVGEEAAEAEPFVAPRTAVEAVVAELWQDVLGREPVGVHEPFLAAGGDSMLAARLVARLGQELDIDLTLAHFLDARTVAEQAAVVEDLLLGRAEDPTGPGA